MLILNGTVRVPEGGLEKLREAAAAQVAATLEEPGCIRYAFAQAAARCSSASRVGTAAWP